ncbi:MAG: hypothetical protein LBM12_01300 [Candidatus Nomurabacteria bacterium]|jgi:antitoxin component of RelBE/YafQ-DinJ toxin-antitoxin module|nr:hypothetical protein [Candidatus Nomurabacteria bacterium]
MTNINIRVENSFKQQLEQFARQLGLPITTVIEASVRDAMEVGEVSFRTDPDYAEQMEMRADIKAYDRARRFNRGPNISLDQLKQTLAADV